MCVIFKMVTLLPFAAIVCPQMVLTIETNSRISLHVTTETETGDNIAAWRPSINQRRKEDPFFFRPKKRPQVPESLLPVCCLLIRPKGAHTKDCCRFSFLFPQMWGNPWQTRPGRPLKVPPSTSLSLSFFFFLSFFLYGCRLSPEKPLYYVQHKTGGCGVFSVSSRGGKPLRNYNGGQP